MELIQPHPGYPKIISLADRLGVEPYDRIAARPALVIACGPNATDPVYALEDLLTAFLDFMDEKVT